MVVDSQLVLIVSNVLSPIKASICSTIGSDLELLIISIRIVAELDLILLNEPVLARLLMADVENEVGVFTISVSISRQAVATCVLDVA